MRANQVVNIKTTKTKPNSWGSGKPLQVTWPKLTDIERRMILNWDEEVLAEPAPASRRFGAKHEHLGETDHDRFFIDGKPIRVVKNIGNVTCRKIRQHLGVTKSKNVPLLTKSEVCWKYDLRAEWLEEVLANPDVNYFCW